MRAMETATSSVQWLGVFDDPEAILDATRESRRQGFDIVDVYTPYAVHGLDEAMGLRPSWLPWVCLLCGLAGGVGMLWFATWALAVDWPSNIGGKPFVSTPAVIPIVFETVVLFGGYGAILALLIHCRLLPGRRPRLVHPRVTDDRFVIALREGGGRHPPGAARALLEGHGALAVEVRREEVTS